MKILIWITLLSQLGNGKASYQYEDDVITTQTPKTKESSAEQKEEFFQRRRNLLIRIKARNASTGAKESEENQSGEQETSKRMEGDIDKTTTRSVKLLGDNSAENDYFYSGEKTKSLNRDTEKKNASISGATSKKFIKRIHKRMSKFKLPIFERREAPKLYEPSPSVDKKVCLEIGTGLHNVRCERPGVISPEDCTRESKNICGPHMSCVKKTKRKLNCISKNNYSKSCSPKNCDPIKNVCLRYDGLNSECVKPAVKINKKNCAEEVCPPRSDCLFLEDSGNAPPIVFCFLQNPDQVNMTSQALIEENNLLLKIIFRHLISKIWK